MCVSASYAFVTPNASGDKRENGETPFVAPSSRPTVGAQVNLAGADGSDAHHDQEREVRDAIVQLRRRPEEGQDVTDR